MEKPNSLGGMECLPWLQAQASVGSDYTPNHSDWGEVAQVMLRVTDSGHSCLLSRVSVRATNERREATDEEAYGARNRQHRSGCQPEDEAGTERTGPREPQRPNPSPDNSVSLVNKHPPTHTPVRTSQLCDTTNSFMFKPPELSVACNRVLTD